MSFVLSAFCSFVFLSFFPSGVPFKKYKKICEINVFKYSKHCIEVFYKSKEQNK